MRLVLDTNTVVSALLWGGAPRLLINTARQKQVELVSSKALLNELQGVLARAKFEPQFAKRGETVESVFGSYAKVVIQVSPKAVPRVVKRDPDDDRVIACAVAAHADVIVSGDRDLLDLGQHEGIAILTAADMLNRLA